MYPTKKYLHFDKVISYNKNVKDYVEDSNKIERHSFFPFIKFILQIEKFISYEYLAQHKEGSAKIKRRPIMYASHIDGFIYKYYGEELNKKYNELVKNKEFDECVTAYRNNKAGKCNIDYAFEVFKFITDCKDCYVMVGDYSGFFDELQHSYLKEKIQDVLKVDRMPKDFYKVFRSLTNYSYINKSDIESYIKDNGVKIQTKYFECIKDFRAFKKQTDVLQSNNNLKGIPQGSAMSAVLANVYMIDVDWEIKKLISVSDGLYRRYSDDFVIVIPSKSLVDTDAFKHIITQVEDIIEISQLSLQKNKTKMFKYQDKSIKDMLTAKKSLLDYLGFCFDGINLTVRQRSIYKYYRNAYKSIKIAQKRSLKKESNKLIGKRKIYALYTDLGKYSNYKYRYKKRKYRGSFISYIKRADKMFRNNSDLNCLILEQIANRKKKIFDKCRIIKPFASGKRSKIKIFV